MVKLKPIRVEGLREVEAHITSVVKNCECESCKRGRSRAKFKPKREHWHIQLQPTDTSYRIFHLFLTADSAYAEDHSTAGEGTTLGLFVGALLSLGLDAPTVDSLLLSTKGKKFLFTRERPPRALREIWIPKKLTGGRKDRQAG
jgi:hypothetical protein